MTRKGAYSLRPTARLPGGKGWLLNLFKRRRFNPLPQLKAAGEPPKRIPLPATSRDAFSAEVEER